MTENKTIPKKAGIGLRSKHHQEILETTPDVAWVEVHTENFFAKGGITISFLEKIAKLYPISFHGVSLSLGSADGLNRGYLSQLKTLIDRFNPGLVSEHLSWTSYNGVYTHDLLPLPYNEESLNLLANNIDQTQNFLKRKISIENPSTYLAFRSSTMREDEFINALAKKSGCGVLLDVNNVYVSSTNNNFNPLEYKIKKEYITEIHLAGHTVINTSEGDKMIVDTHDDFVCSDVWKLYEHTIKYAGAVPTLIEWDDKLPELRILLEEAQRAQNIINIYNKEHDTQKSTETVS
ncbi:MAG: DUF692 domain-containing protein [Alphaproteobacteria bacterium]|nr:DUF692 domain-containing protein [Alphaproteobacteria bacterium]